MSMPHGEFRIEPGRVGYWNASEADDGGLKYQLDIVALVQDTTAKLRAAEEEATLDIVVNWLRMNGWSVTRDEEKI